MKSKTHGFSIIELMIGLTVIGLIIGGIVSGAHIKRQLELARIVEDLSLVATGVTQFETKYNALPGDMFNATDIFGTLADNQNGNGDGVIRLFTNLAGDDIDETISFWDHLYYAKFLRTSFPGATTMAAEPTKSFFYASENNNGRLTMILARDRSNIAPGDPDRGVLTPRQAKALDSATDDGFHDSGTTQSTNSAEGTAEEGACIDTTTTPNQYNISNRDKDCVVEFVIR